MKLHELPRRSESEHLAMFAEPGERNFVLLEIFSSAPGQITIAGRSSKSYVFRKSENGNGRHSLKIPLSLWMADDGAVARDIMSKPGASLYKIVPLFYLAEAAPETQEDPPQEPGTETPPQDGGDDQGPLFPQLNPEDLTDFDDPKDSTEPAAGAGLFMHDDTFELDPTPAEETDEQTTAPEGAKPNPPGRRRKNS